MQFTTLIENVHQVSDETVGNASPFGSGFIEGSGSIILVQKWNNVILVGILQKEKC